jgi:hypothetical protein
LQKEAADAALLKRFLEYDEDTLGLYDYSRAPSCTIKLYWAVIGAFAQKLDCSLEALTAVTVIHELAHAYTHLGADAQGERWDTDHFSNTPSVVKEGLAQYYTHLLARELYHAGDKDIFIAYRRFLRLQSGPYLVHRKWIFPDRVSPEAMRAAVLEFRRGNILTPSYFEYLSNKAGGRLGLYMNMRRSR